MPQVFISYSRKDTEFVRQLALDLQNAGLAVWWDVSGIPAGTQWPKRIQDGLESSAHFIVVLSPDSIASDWVRKEYTFALSENKVIIPLFYRKCKIPIALTDINYIDFSQNDYAVRFDQLCDILGVRSELRERQEQDRKARERAEADRIVREKAEQQQVARAKQEQLKRERLERERIAQLNQETLNNERLEREKLERNRRARQQEVSTSEGVKGLRLGVVLTVIAVLGLFVFAVVVIGNLLGVTSFQTNAIGLRLFFVVLACGFVVGIHSLTRDDDAWLVGKREIVVMVIGILVLAFIQWLFSGVVFSVPTVSQVALRPAVVIVMFAGYAFGPMVGFVVGAVGNMLGDAFAGFGLFPEWSIGHGLIGFISGSWMLLRDRKQSMIRAMYASAVLVFLATLVYFIFPQEANWMYFDPAQNIYGDAPISLLAALSPIIGFVLVIAVRFRPGSNEAITESLIWSMLGNIVGLLFAAISDVWVYGISLSATIVGQFLPVAGPNLIFMALLVPLLVDRYTSTRGSSGR